MKESYQITNNPKYSAAAAAADELVLAHWIGSSSCFQCLRAGPLHMHLQQLPDAFALAHCACVAAAADYFVLAQCICNCSSCRHIRVGPLHRQLLLLPMPLSWPIRSCTYFHVGPLHMRLQELLMHSLWPAT